ncbi:hypothetical protein BCR36DRAFT_319362 [Piromyces finnis]|uniref:Uncharacterized protein n=1 Tax=Piromyces finnis TaxID=1754191 RepID=A0A1Y1VIN1_9FUNG|nr:hypothetical protein BCR36DRAFT_319362 [Piromyces finnis]|eukprot:ORX57188.1 hypothetical protein BCR36DRAFT_319362 [Piromyces finnis]
MCITSKNIFFFLKKKNNSNITEMEASLIIFFIFIIFVLISACIWIVLCNTCCGNMLLESLSEKIPCLKCFVRENRDFYSFEEVALSAQEV